MSMGTSLVVKRQADFETFCLRELFSSPEPWQVRTATDRKARARLRELLRAQEAAMFKRPR